MSFLKKSLVVTLGQFLGIFLNMIAGIIFARALGPEGVGQFELFRSTQVIVVTFLALGMGNASIYFLNSLKIDQSDVISTTLQASLFLSIALFFILIICVYAIPSYFGTASIYGILLFSFGASSLLNSTTLRPILTAQLASKRMVIVDLIPRLVMLLFGLVMLFTGIKNIDLAIMGIGIGNSVAFLLLYYYFKTNITFKKKFNWALFKNILTYGVKLSAANLILVLTSNITIMLLRIFQNENFNQVGYYTRAVAISTMASIIPATIGPLLYSKWSKISKNEVAVQASYVMRISLFASIIISSSIIIFSKEIILIMYGAEFLPAVSAVRILSLSLIFICISSVCNNVLAGDGKAGITMKIFIGTFSIVTFLTWLLVDSLGINGAAIAVLSGNFFTAFMAMIICTRRYNFSYYNSLVIKRLDFESIISLIKKAI